MLLIFKRTLTCGWKVLPATSVNKGCCSHQASRHCSRPWLCTLRGFRMERSRTLALESWGAYQRKDFSEPRLLHLPIHRKVLNSLTWDVWFSLINSNLLMFWLLGFCCKKLLYIPAPPFPLWSSPSGEWPRGCLPGSSPQFCLPDKT